MTASIRSSTFSEKLSKAELEAMCSSRGASDIYQYIDEASVSTEIASSSDCALFKLEKEVNREILTQTNQQ